LHDGDRITIDIPNHQLTAHLTDDALMARKATWDPPKKDVGGYLKRYAASVSSAIEGAIVRAPEE
jgi:dihydroxy-acid dehydratase